MRYAAPLAMPVALGEWLGAELEARGVEAAPHYARAVLSILLQSHLEPHCDMETETARLAALELQIRLEQQKDKEKRGRSRTKKPVKVNSHSSVRGTAGPGGNPKQSGTAPQRRRPHSWNGDEDELKKCAAIECLLSATDDEAWPVEKFIDEVVTRLKIYQLEGIDRFRINMGSSAPNFYFKREFDGDSLTSVSTTGEIEDYLTAFPPLLDDEDDASQHSTVWAGRRVPSEEASPRVPFVRMPGTRLSPSLGSSVSPDAYLGDCSSSRSSSFERQDSGVEGCSKGRLYQRGKECEAKEEQNWSCWADWSAPAKENIWAPDQQDWNLLGKCEMDKVPAVFAEANPVDPVVQKSLALLNHNPYFSSFARVTPGQWPVVAGSKIFEWMGPLESKHSSDPAGEDEEIENLLISPKTHFCPIQEEGDGEVDIKDGVTFEIDSEPDQVHFLRSPNGALYLPEIEENGFGWVGWIKYTVYNPPSPDPLDDDICQGKMTSAFPLKIRVVQNDKGCQTEFSVEEEQNVAVVTPFGMTQALFYGGEVWKFDVGLLVDSFVKDQEIVEKPENEEEEDDGEFLKEVWEVAIDEAAVKEEDVQISGSLEDAFVFLDESMSVNECPASVEADLILDEIWDPLMQDDDVCEWLSQPVAEEVIPEQQQEFEWLMGGESWPPPHIPVEYLDDEIFEEIIGSVESKGSVSEGKRKSRRRRRNSKKQSQQHVQQRRRPCSFFVEGQCHQTDCKYSHELGAIPCRFWLESTCFKGVACPFLHAKPSASKSRTRNRSESCSDASEGGRSGCRRSRTSSTKTFELDLDNDFPSLSQAAEEVKPKSRPIPIKKSGSAAADRSGSSLETSGTASTKRRRKKSSGQRSLKTEAAAVSTDSSPAFRSLDSGVSTSRLRFLSSYKEG